MNGSSLEKNNEQKHVGGTAMGLSHTQLINFIYSTDPHLQGCSSCDYKEKNCQQKHICRDNAADKCTGFSLKRISYTWVAELDCQFFLPVRQHTI